MNIYKIINTKEPDYDTYNSAVVYAKTDDDAKRIHPNGESVWEKDTWTNDAYNTHTEEWCLPDDVIIIALGIAVGAVKSGVIVASFNAG